MDETKLQEIGLNFISMCSGVLKAINMYEIKNDTVQTILKSFTSFLNDSIKTVGGIISISYGNQNFFINGRLVELSFQIYQTAINLGKILEITKVTEIIFRNVIKDDVLSNFLKAVYDSKEKEEELKKTEFENISFRKFKLMEIGEEGAEGFDLNEYVLKMYSTGLVLIRDIIVKIEKGEPFDILQVRKLFQSVIDNYDSIHAFLIATLHQTNFRSYLFSHLFNTALWAIIFGKKLNIDKNNLLILAFSGLFHDIGKIKIPNAIIYKNTHLSPEEEKILKTISYHSVDVLLQYFQESENDLMTFLTIYETLIGADEKKGGTMLFPRIIAICDAYDSLTTMKPYRDAYLPQTALRIMLNDEKFDLKLLNMFVNLVTFYPIGTSVELSTGEVAVVYSTFEDEKKMFTPKVIPIIDSNFEFFDKKQILDLSDPLQKKKRQIKKAVDPYVYGINPMFSFFDAKEI